jgi:uncharacterized RDD family membrane protein YckC
MADQVAPVPLPIEVGDTPKPERPTWNRETLSQFGTLGLPTLTTRIISRSIDLVITLFVGIAVTILEVVLGPDPLNAHVIGIADLAAVWLDHYGTEALHGVGAALLFSAIYNMLSGLRGGQTVGRGITGTILIRRDGQSLGRGRTMVRALLSVFSFAAFGAGYTWSLVDPMGRTWHDILTGTLIIKRPQS